MIKEHLQIWKYDGEPPYFLKYTLILKEIKHRSKYISK